MVRRKYYSKKGLGKEMYAILAVIILVIVRDILIYIKDNPIILLTAILSVVLLGILKFYINKQKRLQEEQRERERLRAGRSINYLLNKFKNNPTDFEVYVAKIFSHLGYKTEVTRATNDGGKDIILYKGRMKYVVEVKLYSEHNKIGREKIQKLQGAMLDSVADKAIFVTTSKFTKESIAYGKKHDIILIDGKSLVKLIDKVLSEEESHVNNQANPMPMIEKLFE